MTDTFTPGKWEVIPLRGCWAVVSSNLVVADMLHEKDATLIAAAPDLLRALERYAGISHMITIDEWVEIAREARAAIAKARGE